MVKNKNYAGFSLLHVEYNNMVVNPVVSPYPKRFSALAERKRGCNMYEPKTNVELSVRDLSMLDWGLSELAAFAAREVVERVHDEWQRDYYTELLGRVEDLQTRLNASMLDLR